MPSVPANTPTAPLLPKDAVDEKWLLMAAAQMHEMGRLVEPEFKSRVAPEVGPAGLEALDAKQPPYYRPNLEVEGKVREIESATEKRIREIEEEYERGMFELKRGKEPSR